MYHYNLAKLVRDFEKAGEDINNWFVTEESYEYDDPYYSYEITVFVKGSVIGVDDDDNNVYEHKAELHEDGLKFFKGVTEICQVWENQPPQRIAYYERIES